jgi:ketosteroid isomerase-like protein
MIQEASRLTDGTFSLRIREAVAHGEQVAAFIDWSSTRDGKTLEGKEIAVYRIRDARIVEAYFYQDNLSHDEEFWS